MALWEFMESVSGRTREAIFVESASVAIANEVGSPRFSSLDLTDMQSGPDAESVRRLLATYQVPLDQIDEWHAVAHAIAVATPPGITVHTAEVPPGQAMALAGVSGDELEELVHSSGPELVAVLERVCARLRTGGQGCDCVALAAFVLSHYGTDHPKRTAHTVKMSKHFAIANRDSA